MTLRASLLLLALASAASAQTPLLTLESPTPRSPGLFGLSVVALDDVDGDEAGDLVVSAMWEAGVVGRVHVFSGASGALLRSIHSPTPQSDGLFGVDVSAIPDLDGDGVQDLVVGASRESDGPTSYGRVHVFSGATGTLIHTLFSPPPQVRFGFSNPEFGSQVSGLQDLDGDGRGDLIVGAHTEGADGAGRAHVYSGASGDVLFSLTSANPTERGRFGDGVSGIPDVDGDGTPDLLVGAPLESAGASRSGRAYIFSGASGALVRTLTSPNASANGFFGRPALGVADADGDGRGDVLVGAAREASGAGRAYLISGATGALIRTFESPNPEARGWFGEALAEVPDVDGDAAPELLVGAPEEDASGILSAGRGYLFSGASGLLLATLESPDPTGEFTSGLGSGVAGVPDVNGDGRGDLLLGVPKEASNAGRAYLFSGSVAVAAEPGAASGVALSVAANPSARPLVQLGLLAPEAVRVSIVDLLGREVALLHDGPLALGVHTFALDMPRLAPGVYVLRAATPEATSTRRVTVVR